LIQFPDNTREPHKRCIVASKDVAGVVQRTEKRHDRIELAVERFPALAQRLLGGIGKPFENGRRRQVGVFDRELQPRQRIFPAPRYERR
jgi:hypothetical protein